MKGMNGYQEDVCFTEKLTILKIKHIEKNVFGGVTGYCYIMIVVSDYDGIEREVVMGFGPDGKGIYASDYKNNVQFHFEDKNISIEQCEIGYEYKVKADKMQSSEMVASIVVQTQSNQI